MKQILMGLMTLNKLNINAIPTNWILNFGADEYIDLKFTNEPLSIRILRILTKWESIHIYEISFQIDQNRYLIDDGGFKIIPIT